MAAGWANMADSDDLASSRSTINTGFTELTNLHRGASEPTNKGDGMLWLDTGTSTVKIYDSSGAAWVTLVPARTSTNGGIAQVGHTNSFSVAQTGTAATASTHYPLASQVTGRIMSIVYEITFANSSHNRYLWAIPATGRYAVSGVYLMSDTATTGSDGSNNWTFQVANLTAANNLCSSAKTTNGAEIAADTRYSFGVNQNNAKADLNGGAILQLQITKTGTPTSLASARVSVQVDYTVDMF